jgi:hypothetical protein
MKYTKTIIHLGLGDYREYKNLDFILVFIHW